MTLTLALTAQMALGFWAPNHQNINLQVLTARA